MITGWQFRQSDYVVAQDEAGNEHVYFISIAEQSKHEDDGLTILRRFSVPEVLEILRRNA